MQRNQKRRVERLIASLLRVAATWQKGRTRNRREGEGGRKRKKGRKGEIITYLSLQRAIPSVREACATHQDFSRYLLGILRAGHCERDSSRLLARLFLSLGVHALPSRQLSLSREITGPRPSRLCIDSYDSSGFTERSVILLLHKFRSADTPRATTKFAALPYVTFQEDSEGMFFVQRGGTSYQDARLFSIVLTRESTRHRSYNID